MFQDFYKTLPFCNKFYEEETAPARHLLFMLSTLGAAQSDKSNLTLARM